MPDRLCRLADLNRTGAKGVTLGRGRFALEIVVIRHGEHIYAYENSCPHLAMPLETRADHFLDERGLHLVCSTHGARFAATDGYCVSGPCQGASLKALAIEIRDDNVYLVDPAQPAPPG